MGEVRIGGSVKFTGAGLDELQLPLLAGMLFVLLSDN